MFVVSLLRLRWWYGTCIPAKSAAFLGTLPLSKLPKYETVTISLLMFSCGLIRTCQSELRYSRIIAVGGSELWLLKAQKNRISSIFSLRGWQVWTLVPTASGSGYLPCRRFDPTRWNRQLRILHGGWGLTADVWDRNGVCGLSGIILLGQTLVTSSANLGRISTIGLFTYCTCCLYLAESYLPVVCI